MRAYYAWGGVRVEFFDYLLDAYGRNEAILSNEIAFKGYSAPWIKKALKSLCDAGKVIRFEKGVYYIPEDTPLGPGRLDPRKVIAKKYICDGKSVIGYFSGLTFLNMLGLSTQMPNVLELYTNNEPSRVREVPVGSQRVLLRRARTAIDSDNAATLSFLELMNFTDAAFYDDGKKKTVASYIEDNGITRSSIARYAPCFPDRAMRTLVESGIVYDVTR